MNLRVVHERVATVTFLAIFVSARSVVALGAPKVVELIPENGATDVDPTTAELRITFDRDMNTQGYSLCGGGQAFPKLRGRPKWAGKRTLIIKVKLDAEHEYTLGINCPSFQNFRGADDKPVAAVRWTFATGARRSKADQRELNKRSFDELMEALHEDYSYYKYRNTDWKTLQKKNRKKIIAARNTPSWVTKVAKMLAEAKDLHLWFTFGGRQTPTHRRRIKPNYRMEGVKAMLPGLTRRDEAVYVARTEDAIGYVMITGWSRGLAKEPGELQDVLEELSDTRALIIDVRANSGGDELLARTVAAWFIEGEKVYAKNVYRDSNSKTGFGPVLSRTLTGNKPPRRYDKPVALLMGRANMSSCEAFLLMMKQGENVTLIGARSYGSSGNPKPRLLENGVEVFIPSWKALRPDGTCFEGKGIAPDIQVKAGSSAFKTGDPVIERALQLLRKKDSESREKATPRGG